MIPNIDVSALYDAASATRDAVDAAVADAARNSGFLTVNGLPGDTLSPELRRRLLSIFDITEAKKRALLRHNFAPENENLYRGWFPLQDGYSTYKEGIDIGADLVDPTRPVDPDDPLTEKTPLPDLPDWRAAATQYYTDMSAFGAVMMRSLARGLDLPEDIFADAFRMQNSTLRMIHYPPRTEKSFGADADRFRVEHDGKSHYLLGAPHVDSGFVTLLAQDGVAGLQARMRDGSWITIPPLEGTLAVNFGKLLERWTGGAIKATLHRVIGSGARRCSIPFFYEPSIDAVIAPIDGCGEPFEPVLYGDHLWEATTGFVEQVGIADRRTPKGPPGRASR